MSPSFKRLRSVQRFGGFKDRRQAFVENLVDLAVGNDERRRECDGIAGDAQHDVMLVKSALHGMISALAGLTRQWSQVDTGDKTNGAHILHQRMALERHCGIGPAILDLAGTLEESFLLVKIQGREPW